MNLFKHHFENVSRVVFRTDKVIRPGYFFGLLAVDNTGVVASTVSVASSSDGVTYTDPVTLRFIATGATSAGPAIVVNGEAVLSFTLDQQGSNSGASRFFRINATAPVTFTLYTPMELNISE